MKKKLIYLTSLLITLSACIDYSDTQSNNCEPIDEKYFDWITQQKNDTVIVRVGTINKAFLVTENSYEYDPNQAIDAPFASICISDWQCKWQNDSTIVNFGMNANSLVSSNMNINNTQLSFSRTYKRNGKKYALYEQSKDSKNLTVESVVLEYGKGLVEIRFVH